ncbi:MAG: bifunctional glutamate N-acetyltransferase/amino-acid acetyltransferase ArgJ [Alphaproteobacteria bacterium]|jgi:glutamate N-acetyltransferase/amino-acid N-acetyltransferase|nr:bifunctional glutamate N-acetyltransferase/amino-acid acetyltransferase ArgJ [Alphaproteobacteria bacterium]MDP6567068.1 bifunctional glutamate N-acetyltransferase/amino-acid acetyltransferase ArgJ [Alphaproteobacteria bacterium]MDP6811585.1 bifunctional glutamate N-acetyltransferase/amino-acid acetyltransferase ArgJ [Alphaproteobacteria bacterium]
MPETPTSPFAPERFPKLPAIAGLRLAALAAGERYRARADLTLAELAPGSTIAGVFTRSTMPGAPVTWCRRYIGRGRARAIVVNAGNANVFTGRQGAADVRATAGAVAAAVGCRPADVLVASTGVIGENLAVDRLLRAIPRLHGKLRPRAWAAAARAICTTDTFAKGAAAEATIDGHTVRIAGIAKGSGMIAPDMATMLAFIFTDAKLPADVLRSLLRWANQRSFNCITVDGDTSTSDTVLLAATGQGPRHGKVAAAGDRRLAPFKAALLSVMRDLAQQVVRDGEGASKFIEIQVSGAASARAARRIALTIANSPLVKTAIAGEDANWGRIIMAVGRAGEKADRDRLGIRVGGVQIAEHGHPHPDYREEQVQPHMEGREIEIAVDVGVGRGKATVWTCDLTHGYISINADYRS